ncbi:serine/threonine protein kinase [Streptomyces bambusae]|uniref:serine/threonine-protein kinase n=1 Tax=Streptomyces bambusae TaxID=1550616 RepID=UPI001CFC6370|nr:serine/threonine-protein kinase [Streptomyces bambusae]MCB5164098.1 serine/threonine protein kinase [Streptomyces bambusae]
MSARLPALPPAHEALTADDPREIGGYRLHARLGAGGMGVVYLAHTPGGRPIALKAVREEFAGDPEFRSRFAQEVASARRIHGLFTAQVVDSGVDARTPWLATAYVPGPSLHQVVRRHGPLPPRTVLLLMAGVAEALQAIHAAGVVHRDLKPANVLLASDGPRVIDFGIARAADATALTGTGLRIGTAAFMAPEQALGLPVTPATDVFALGALAAYVASGAAPFGAGPESAALYRVVHEHPDLAAVPAGLRDLLAWCLTKRPEDRPAPGTLIAAVHAHPLMGAGHGFAEGWLPHEVGRELAGPPAGPPSLPVHDQPTAVGAPPFPAPTAPGPVPTAPGFPVQAPGGPSAEAPRRGRRTERRRRSVVVPAVAATVALAGAAGAGVWFLGPQPEARGAVRTPRTPAAAAPAGTGGTARAGAYAPTAAGVELTAPDASYEFDLAAAKVVPADTAQWYLARDERDFVVPEAADAYVAAGDGLGPEECVRGIETEPVTVLAVDELADERPFCVRSPDGRDLAVVRLLETEPDGGAVTVLVDRYRWG